MKTFLLVFVLLVPPAWADITGNVVRVLDGDTLIVQSGGEQHRVRLTGIDAPEKKQAYGVESQLHLLALIGNKNVTIISSKSDRYSRLLGKVVIDNQDINLQMVVDGYAWWYKAYQGEQSPIDRFTYQQAEMEARKAGKGLWAGNPMAPWDFRRQ